MVKKVEKSCVYVQNILLCECVVDNDCVKKKFRKYDCQTWF